MVRHRQHKVARSWEVWFFEFETTGSHFFSGFALSSNCLFALFKCLLIFTGLAFLIHYVRGGPTPARQAFSSGPPSPSRHPRNKSHCIISHIRVCLHRCRVILYRCRVMKEQGCPPNTLQGTFHLAFRQVN